MYLGTCAYVRVMCNCVMYEVYTYINLHEYIYYFLFIFKFPKLDQAFQPQNDMLVFDEADMTSLGGSENINLVDIEITRKADVCCFLNLLHFPVQISE